MNNNNNNINYIIKSRYYIKKGNKKTGRKGIYY